MENIRLRYIIVEAKVELATQLEALLSHEQLFRESGEVAETLIDALELLSTESFDLCFVGECFKPEQLTDFFGDVGNRSKNRSCVCIAVTNAEVADPATASVPHPGFSLVLSRRAKPESIKLLLPLLESTIREKETQWRLAEIERSLEPLFGELDLIASERKRGVNKAFNGVASQYIELLTGDKPEYVEKYFEHLTSKAAASAPNAVPTKVELPDWIVKHGLPQFGKDGYRGVSARVWSRIQKAMAARKGETDDAAESAVGNTKPKKVD